MKEEKIEIRFTPINGNVPIEMFERIRKLLEEAMEENLVTTIGMTAG